MNTRIPVTIVTGFLGSGKTTLLRSLVARRQERRLAILINEFGEISIDSALVQEAASAFSWPPDRKTWPRTCRRPAQPASSGSCA